MYHSEIRLSSPHFTMRFATWSGNIRDSCSISWIVFGHFQLTGAASAVTSYRLFILILRFLSLAWKLYLLLYLFLTFRMRNSFKNSAFWVPPLCFFETVIPFTAKILQCIRIESLKKETWRWQQTYGSFKKESAKSQDIKRPQAHTSQLVVVKRDFLKTEEFFQPQLSTSSSSSLNFNMYIFWFVFLHGWYVQTHVRLWMWICVGITNTCKKCEQKCTFIHKYVHT